MHMQTHRHTQTQSSSGTVEQPNGCRHKGAPEALRLAPGEHEPVAEGAPHLPQLSMEGMGGVAHDGLEFVPHPPLHHHLQTVQLKSHNRAGFPNQRLVDSLIISITIIKQH